ncbi:MAG: L-seryl-tRNA(Sec) selenium transferase [Dehalococcoidales bacterium]|nr:L-seryl-tRNA(Sec) selenium transferase [Dehalococcoidales bacterium]
MSSELRHLPGVDKLLAEERIKTFQDSYPHELVVKIARQQLEQERLAITTGKTCPSLDEIVEAICARLRSLGRPSLRPVINATGVILHTNLGRAPLSRETIAAMESVARGYCNLEFDLDSGNRGSRNTHIVQLLCQLTGAEAALVVNSNAAAVLLGLTALARRKEVIVSRGQAVEIGGGFRIPDVMRQSGAKLVEVGTTNCTYVADYEQAIGDRTVALMRVHSSNFQITGFTNSVTVQEMVTLARRHNLTVFDDLGSGCLLDTSLFGLAPEPVVPQSVALGAGLVFFSGDKLVGGPQAGIIVGQKELVARLEKHPLARAVRIDKVRLAGLIATLMHYVKGEATTRIPIWRLISMPLEDIDRRARTWAEALSALAQVIEGESMIGGGSLPGATLPTRLVAISEVGKRKRQNLAQQLAERLRKAEFPIIGRISNDTLLLDPRSVLPEEDEIVIKALRGLGDTLSHKS